LNITRYEVCDTRHIGSTAMEKVACPNAKGTGNVTQMAGASACGSTSPAPAARFRHARNERPAPLAEAMAVSPELKRDIRRSPGRGGNCSDYGGRRALPGRWGTPGDLYITTKVKTSFFSPRWRLNIEIKVPAGGLGSARGAKIEVPTLMADPVEDPAGHPHPASVSVWREKGVLNPVPINGEPVSSGHSGAGSAR